MAAARLPRIRASYFKAFIAGVKKLPEPDRAALLGDLGDALRVEIRQAALMEWMPASTFVGMTEAVARVLGVEGAVAFWKASMHVSLQRSFLSPLKIGAINIYGKTPGSLVRMTRRAWSLLAKDCGECEVLERGRHSAIVRFTELPLVMRRRSLLYMWAGGCHACIEDVGFEGRVTMDDDKFPLGIAEVIVEW